VRIRLPRQPDDAHHEQVEGVLPVLVVGVEERARGRSARARHEVVDRAELVDGRFHERRDLVRVGQVGGLCDDLAGRDRLDLLLGGRQPLLVAAVNDDVDALAGQRFRRCLSESAGRCRDEGRVPVDL